MEIVPASTEHWPLIADQFAAGGNPKWCWCQAGLRRYPRCHPGSHVRDHENP